MPAPFGGWWRSTGFRCCLPRPRPFGPSRKKTPTENWHNPTTCARCGSFSWPASGATRPPMPGRRRCWACRWWTTGGKPSPAGPCWLPSWAWRACRRRGRAVPAIPCPATTCKFWTKTATRCRRAPPGWWPCVCPCRRAVFPRSGTTTRGFGNATSTLSRAIT